MEEPVGFFFEFCFLLDFFHSVAMTAHPEKLSFLSVACTQTTLKRAEADLNAWRTALSEGPSCEVPLIKLAEGAWSHP